jgi:UDP-N-acetyl-D-mannosaminuronate dehydrogenase
VALGLYVPGPTLRDSMKGNVSVFGLGYVGSVTAACLAHRGHHVVGVDSNAAKTESLELGRSPIVLATGKSVEDPLG